MELKKIKPYLIYFSWFVMILISVYAALAADADNLTAGVYAEEGGEYTYPSFNISIENSYWVCKGSEKVIFPELTNYAPFPDTFTLRIRGNDFAGLVLNNIELPEMSKTQIPIVIKPKDEGLFDFNLVVTDEYGYYSEGKSVIYVDSCIDRRLDVKNSKIKLLHCDSKSYPIRVSNNGYFDKVYNIEFTGPEWAGLSLSEGFTLSPGQYKEFDFELNVPCDVKGSFDAEIVLKIPGERLENRESISIEVYGRNEAYKAGAWHNHPLMIIPKIFAGIFVIVLAYALLKKPVRNISASLKARREKLRIKKEEKKKIKAEKKAAKKLAKENGIPAKSRRGWIYFVIVLAAIAAAAVIFRKEVFPFAGLYKYYIIIGFAALALLIFILHLAVKKRQKSAAGPKEKKMPTPKEMKRRRMINGIGVAFIIFMIIGVAVFYSLGSKTIPQNEFIKPDLENTLVRNGRVISKGDNVVIPLIVDDKGGEAKFAIESRISWIKVDDSELGTAREVKRIYLYVTPSDSMKNQNYLVEINARIDYDEQIINEKIEIELINTQPFMGTYFSFGAAGLIFALLLAFASFFIRKARSKKALKGKEEDVFVFDLKKMKASEILEGQRKHALTGLKKGNERIRKDMQHYVAVGLREKLA